MRSIFFLSFALALIGCGATKEAPALVSKSPEPPPAEIAVITPSPEPKVFVTAISQRDTKLCIERRYKKLYRQGWRYRRFLWHFEKILGDTKPERAAELWNCTTTSASQEKFDRNTLINFYHLGVQALGTKGNLELNFDSNDEELEKLKSGEGLKALSFYRLFPNRASEPFIRLPIVPEILKAYPLFDQWSAARESAGLAIELDALTEAHQYEDEMIKILGDVQRIVKGKEFAVCPHVALSIFIWDQLRATEAVIASEKSRVSSRVKTAFKNSKAYFLSQRFCGTNSVVGR